MDIPSCHLVQKLVATRPTFTKMETSPSDVGFMEAGITLPLISDANSFGTLDGLMGQTASGELSVRMCVQSISSRLMLSRKY